MAMDYYIQFEELHEGIKTVCDKLNLPYDPSKLGDYKTGVRTTRGYREFYDEETRIKIEEAHLEEIEKFNYSF